MRFSMCWLVKWELKLFLYIRRWPWFDILFAWNWNIGPPARGCFFKVALNLCCKRKTSLSYIIRINPVRIFETWYLSRMKLSSRPDICRELWNQVALRTISWQTRSRYIFHRSPASICQPPRLAPLLHLRLRYMQINFILYSFLCLSLFCTDCGFDKLS